MIIATRIHNNSLGRTVSVKSEKEGQDLLKEWAEEQFGRPLNEEEREALLNENEIVNEDDADNIFCFSLGFVE